MYFWKVESRYKAFRLLLLHENITSIWQKKKKKEKLIIVNLMYSEQYEESEMRLKI